MQYKSIVLQLLEQHPQIHADLQRQRKLRSTMEGYAKELKRKHEAWQAELTQVKPQSDPAQLASEALEIALQELENCLRYESLPPEEEPVSLEEAMTFLRRHTPPA